MLSKFKYRSNQKELLDGADIPRGLLHKNLKELDILNRITRGHTISLKGIKQLITDRKKTYHVVDFGCGSGDALRAIADWARLNNFRVRLTGVDINVNAITYLNIHCSNYPEISGVIADYLDYLNSNKSIDIVHCALFCHHLNDEELIRLFIYFKQYLKIGFIINDLRRHWLAYYSAYFITRLLNGTKLAKNDGPISVLRGFVPVELVRILKTAGIKNYFIQKSWSFRILIIGKTGENEGI